MFSSATSATKGGASPRESNCHRGRCRQDCLRVQQHIAPTPKTPPTNSYSSEASFLRMGAFHEYPSEPLFHSSPRDTGQSRVARRTAPSDHCILCRWRTAGDGMRGSGASSRRSGTRQEAPDPIDYLPAGKVPPAQGRTSQSFGIQSSQVLTEHCGRRTREFEGTGS